MRVSLRVLLVCLCWMLCAAQAGAVEVTVVVTSDTHFNGSAPSANVQLVISSMNSITGAAYPAGVGGTVAAPAAAILCGDLCTGGTLFNSASDDKYRQQWNGTVPGTGGFNYYFPLAGDPAAGRVHYPTYAAAGNHDYYRQLGTAVLDSNPSYVIAQELMARYGSGTGGIQEGNVCYSFDLGGAHFVCLGRYADPQVLNWLDADLELVPRETPVVAFLHYALDDSGVWYTAAERDALAAKLLGHRVVCLLHGHTHNSRSYTWRGCAVFDDGAANEDADFGVLRITDSRTDYVQRQVQSGGDYWKWAAQYCTITGYARTGSGPIAGATISATNGGGSVTTGPDGYYNLSVAVGWSGTVTPSKSGIVFSTSPRSYTNIQANTPGQDYVSDWVPPIPGTAASPTVANSSPISVTYTGASDDYALASVEFWYRKGATGSWTDSGLRTAGGSGSFSFTPTGDDTYCFDLVAVDSMGNRSAPASGDGDCQTIYTTAKLLAISNRDLVAHLPEGSTQAFLFAVFGRVTRLGSDEFEVDDGSGAPVRVSYAAHGLETDDYAVARGIWVPDADPPVLNAFGVAKL